MTGSLSSSLCKMLRPLSPILLLLHFANACGPKKEDSNQLRLDPIAAKEIRCSQLECDFQTAVFLGNDVRMCNYETTSKQTEIPPELLKQLLPALERQLPNLRKAAPQVPWEKFISGYSRRRKRGTREASLKEGGDLIEEILGGLASGVRLQASSNDLLQNLGIGGDSGIPVVGGEGGVKLPFLGEILNYLQSTKDMEQLGLWINKMLDSLGVKRSFQFAKIENVGIISPDPSVEYMGVISLRKSEWSPLIASAPMDESVEIQLQYFLSHSYMRIRLCCDGFINCPLTSRKAGQWKMEKTTCSRGTQQVMIICENAAESEAEIGGCGVASVKLIRANSDDELYCDGN